MKCYHHNDADGRCAGAIVHEARPEAEMIEIKYKDSVDVGAIRKDEYIFIVDFSFKPGIMEEVLKKTKNVVWIDHHKTAMEYDYGTELDGIRTSKYSGCELTWQYFHEFNKKIPEAILLIGDYDTWTFRYGEKSDLFHIGIQLYDHSPLSDVWDGLLIDDLLTDKIINDGRICQKFRDNLCKDYRKSFGFETILNGYKCFAMGIYKFGSKGFGELINKYDICINFEFDGKQWTIGLYSTKIDVGKLAKEHYGGGGHTGAAGFVCKELPFKQINQ